MLTHIKIYLTLLIFGGLATISYGQRVNIDSLKNVFETDIPDTIRIQIGITLSEGLRSSDASSAMYYNDQALNLAEKNGHENYLAKAKLAKIPLLAYSQQIEEAEALAIEALEYYKKINKPSYILTALNSLGILRKMLRKYDEALETYNEALEVADNANLLETKAKILINKANVQSISNDFIGATQTSFNALKLLEMNKDEEGAALLYNNIGILYKDQNNLDKALEYYQLSRKKLISLDDKMGQINALVNIANVYISRKQNDLAFVQYKEVLQLAQEMGYNQFILTAKTYMAYFLAIDKKDEEATLLVKEIDNQVSKMRFKDKETYYNARATLAANTRKWTQAIQYQKEALSVARQNGNLDGIADQLRMISSFYKELNNYKAAYEAFEEYKILSDSATNESNLLEIELKAAQYDFDKEQAIQKAKFKNQELIAEKKLRTRNLIGIGLIFGLLVAIGWGNTIRRANKKEKEYNKKLEQEVTARTADLKTSNDNLEQANYELRTFNHIASHDIKEPIRNIGNYVGLIKRKLSDDQKVTLEDYFNTIQKSTKQLYTVIEDFAFYTALSKDDDIKTEAVNINELIDGVSIALNNFIEEKKGQVIINEFPIIQSNKSMLYVALKHLIENGIKYNQSETPTVTFSYNETPNTYQILVSDNGIGIEKKYHEKIFEMFKKLDRDQEKANSGMGLSVVLLVLKKLKGSISIESKKGKGSTFIIELPK